MLRNTGLFYYLYIMNECQCICGSCNGVCLCYKPERNHWDIVMEALAKIEPKTYELQPFIYTEQMRQYDEKGVGNGNDK